MFNHINNLLECKIAFKNIASGRWELGLLSLLSSVNCMTIYHGQSNILYGVLWDLNVRKFISISLTALISNRSKHYKSKLKISFILNYRPSKTSDPKFWNFDH